MRLRKTPKIAEGKHGALEVCWCPLMKQDARVVGALLFTIAEPPHDVGPAEHTEIERERLPDPSSEQNLATGMCVLKLGSPFKKPLQHKALLMQFDRCTIRAPHKFHRSSKVVMPYVTAPKRAHVSQLTCLLQLHHEVTN